MEMDTMVRMGVPVVCVISNDSAWGMIRLVERFIRPEDVPTYEKCGIEFIKIAGRGRDAARLLRTARAYAERHYDGNLLDITDLVGEIPAEGSKFQVSGVRCQGGSDQQWPPR